MNYLNQSTNQKPGKSALGTRLPSRPEMYNDPKIKLSWGLSINFAHTRDTFRLLMSLQWKLLLLLPKGSVCVCVQLNLHMKFTVTKKEY